MRIRAAKKKTNFWNPGDACITNPKIKKFRTENLWNHDSVGSVSTENTNKIIADDNNCLKSVNTDCFQVKNNYISRLMFAREKFQDPEVYFRANQIVENINKNFITEDIDITDTKIKQKYFELLLKILNAPNYDEINQSAILFLLYHLLKSSMYDKFDASFSSLYENMKIILNNTKYKRTLVHNYALKISIILLKSIKKEHCSRQNIDAFYSQVFQFIFHQNPIISKTALKQILRFIEKSGSDIIFNIDVKIFNQALSESSEFPFKMKPLMKLLPCYLKFSSLKNRKKICSRIFHVFLSASTIIRCMILDTFSAVFKSSCYIPPELFTKLYSIMMELKPGCNDEEEFVTSWMKMATNLYGAYYHSSDSVTFLRFTENFSSHFTFFHSRIAGIPALACDNLVGIMRDFKKYYLDKQGYDESVNMGFQDFLRNAVANFPLSLPTIQHYICTIAENILKIAPPDFKCPEDVLLKICTLCGDDIDANLKTHIFSFLKSFTDRNGYIEIFNILKNNAYKEASSFEKFMLVDFLKTLSFNDGFSIVREIIIPLSDHLNSKRNKSINSDYCQLCDANYYKLFSLMPQLLKSCDDLNEFKSLSPILLEYVKCDVRKSPFILEGMKYLCIQPLKIKERAELITPYIVEWLPVLFDKYIHHVTPDAVSGLVYQVLKHLFVISEQFVIDDYYQQFDSRLSSCTESSLKYHIDIILLLLRHISYGPLLKAFTSSLNNLNPHDEKPFKLQLKYILNIHKNSNGQFYRYHIDNLSTISSQYSFIHSAKVPSCTHIFIEILKEMVCQLPLESHSAYFYQFVGYVVESLQNPSIKNSRKSIKFVGNCYLTVKNLHFTYNKFVTKLIHEYSTKFLTGCLEFILIFWKNRPFKFSENLSAKNINLLLKLFQNSTKRQFSTLLQILEHVRKTDDFNDHFLNTLNAIFKRIVLVKVKSNQSKIQKYIKKAVSLLGYDKVKAVIPIENQRLFRSLYKKSIKRVKKSVTNVKSENYDETHPDYELQESEDVVDISNFNYLKRKKITGENTECDFLTDKDGKIIIESEGSSYEEEEIGESHPEYMSSNGSNDSDDGGDEVNHIRSTKNINKTLIDINSKTKPEKVVRFGNEYKSVKGGGDMKLKGKPDPYSYVPLSARRAGKKNINQLSGQFKGIVKAKKSLKRLSKS